MIISSQLNRIYWPTLREKRRTSRISKLLTSLAILATFYCLIIATDPVSGDDAPQQTTPLANTNQQPAAGILKGQRDFRWPNKQVNMLVDLKSLNQTEQQVLSAMFDQIERKTCLTIDRLSGESVNPFDARNLPESERNFVYIFKTQFGPYNRHPSIGLSSLGCIRQGRQSMVLTDLAFKWPELVLRYHVLRTIGLDGLERPDAEVKRLLNMLPLNQKIISNEDASITNMAEQPLILSSPANLVQASQVDYLHEEDYMKIKQLYGCTELQNRLSVKPINEVLNEQTTTKLPEGPQQSSYSTIPQNETTSTDDRRNLLSEGQKRKLDEAEESIREIFENLDDSRDREVNEKLIKNAAKHIVDYLLASDQNNIYLQTTIPNATPADSSGGAFTIKQCDDQPAGSCPVEAQGRSTITPAEPADRPMILKLDEFHAQDPSFKQANQMKLSQLTNDSLAFRLMNAPDSIPIQQPGNNFQGAHWNPPKSEMLISFEQVPIGQSGNPVATLASSQVLKLCSCTCQTMAPVPNPFLPAPVPQPSPVTKPVDDYDSTTQIPPMRTTLAPEQPPYTFPSEKPGDGPTSPSIMPPPEITSEMPATTESETQPTYLSPSPPTAPYPTSTEMPQTTSPPSVSPPPPSMATETLRPDPATQYPERPTSAISDGPQTPGAMSYCNLVEWVQPNKSVYASARIVWDVDRANQNYFLCNNMINGELVPGKTHGFSCKLSSEGKSYELHNFSVLTKPENVNLAWVQRNSDSFGKTNFPVIGGFSKKRDPYIVSRCLVRDENNDVLTLIGYVNSQGSGWFPFDDIQIECAQYDVLACVI